MTNKLQAKLSAIVTGVFGFIAFLQTVPPEQQSGMLGLLAQIFPVEWQPQIALWSKLIATVAGFWSLYKASHSGPAPEPPPNPVSSRIAGIVLIFGCLSLASCATTQAPVITESSPVAVVGQDLNTAAQRALADYAKVEGGGTNMVWALQELFYAYENGPKTVADVKSLITQWTGSKGKPLADRIGILFKTSTGTPAEKMATLAKAATATASQ